MTPSCGLHETAVKTVPRSTIGIRLGLLLLATVIALAEFTYRDQWFYYDQNINGQIRRAQVNPIYGTRGFAKLATAHIVLTRDDHGQSLVLTGDEGKGKGKGGGDQLVIAGNQMGGDGQNSNMIMQDAANREGDVVINGNSMIIPGEDGHIVLADSRSKQGGGGGPRTPPMNPMMFWLPYMNSRTAFRMMPFFGMPFGRR